MNKITKAIKTKIRKFVSLKMIDEHIPEYEKRRFYKTFENTFKEADAATQKIYIQDMDRRIAQGIKQ